MSSAREQAVQLINEAKLAASGNEKVALLTRSEFAPAFCMRAVTAMHTAWCVHQ
jgi:hypothetical protein